MKQEKKSTLEKYYISEAFDKDRNVSFNFKKANKKISGNFTEFTDAVEEFIRVSEATSNDTKCWFHRDGAYRGSVDINKARLIVEKVKEKQVKNEDAITYIEAENLVDKAPAKKVNLNEEALLVSFYVEGAETKTAEEIKAEDIKSESNYPVVIEKVVANGDALDIYYHITNKNSKSDTVLATLTGFAENMQPCECRLEDASEAHPIQYTGRGKNKGFWALVSVLVVLIIINIILIVLRATGKF
ncbi:hypothetical protein [Metamycoplasma neophronis]|uniref:Uncharacterized protein n=1 Tax=Metamycoplasma neophronis TaxID=872983 RepID=A0ABY2Z0M3_9BACT|nr:hypothetical protein [Metamycoplasma neophronis]TPR53716.1 hypothetical protein FJR74_02335 [Metamycoplasma neophronis]